MTSALDALQESSQSQKLFFVTSGEHRTLPAAEIKAIVESEGLRYNSVMESYRLLKFEALSDALKAISERSLMYDLCGLELGECTADEQQILRLVESVQLDRLTGHAGTFAVRSVRLGGASRPIDRVSLEGKVGAKIRQILPRLSVRLRNPDLTFMCVIYDESFLFGLSAYAKPSGIISPRRPRKRPVFHPSTMPPKVARCMVNLSRATPGAYFMDPFSGVGGILIEAAVIGCNVLGMDPNTRMLRGARKNMNHFGLPFLGFARGDARAMPVHGLDAMATDPPYGRGSSTMGTTVSDLVEDFLREAKDSLKRGSHLCISSPSEVEVEAYAKEVGLRVKEKHLARVHRSLTRQFVVLQNT